MAWCEYIEKINKYSNPVTKDYFKDELILLF